MKQINFFLFFIIISINSSFADIDKEFENWKIDFKKIALKSDISENTFDKNLVFDITMSKVFSEILFSKAFFLKFNFQSSNSLLISANEQLIEIKIKNIKKLICFM